LATSAENAEAVADVLARFASGGTAISGETDTAGATLTVCGYLPEPAASEAVQDRVREAIWHLSQISPLPEPTFRWIEAEDWSESWKANFRPLAIGRRLLVLPPWIEQADPERLSLVLDPGMAFGTGAHPSTRMCLEALENLVRTQDVVVDLGCGSGILSVAAALLGAGTVLACDIDTEAIAATTQAAERNGVASQIEVFQGSLPEAAARLADHRPADIVVANILAPILARLLGEGMAHLARPGGWIILAGVLQEQRNDLDASARSAGLEFEAEAVDGIWVTMTYRKPPGLARAGPPAK
jgi:ribosomal protein L11 methyltransferase